LKDGGSKKRGRREVFYDTAHRSMEYARRRDILKRNVMQDKVVGATKKKTGKEERIEKGHVDSPPLTPIPQNKG